MSLNRLLKISPRIHAARDKQPEEDVARLVIGQNGRVLFANTACSQLAGIEPLPNTLFFDLATFANPDEVFRDSPLLLSSEETSFAAVRPGQHTLIFKESGEKASLRFDVVQGKDGRSYIIASGLEEDRNLATVIDALLSSSQALGSSPLPSVVPTTLSEAEARHFLDLSNDLLMICREDGNLETVNVEMSRLMGNDNEASPNRIRSLFDFIHPEDQSVARNALTARSSTFSCRLLSKEAQIFWIEWKLKHENGKIYGIGQNITASKHHENALLRRERQLCEAEAIGRMGYWHWSVGNQSIRFSEGLYKIFGTNENDFKPTLESVSAMFDRQDAERMIQAFQRAVIEQNDHELDFRIRRPNGQMRHILCLGRCEFDCDGDVIGLYGIMQDVTETMENQQALREAKEAAEQAYAAKTQFLANMSHELRTPLNAIIGFSEMMQQQLLGPIGTERYLDYIKGIRESGEHLLDLISDILDMSKIEVGKYVLDLEEINIIKLIRLALHMMEARAGDAGIRISFTPSEEAFLIKADRRAVMQMTLNLLSNAVKFSPKGSEIVVECFHKDGHVFVQIQDHGIGIPAHKIKTIMNPFEQVSSHYTRKHEGTGLGLSITKELAELHGGSVYLQSTLDVGTTATIRLPLDASKTRKDASSKENMAI